MTEAASFLFLTCQVGAEGAVKGELARRWPEFRFSYSRPGFLTFKLPANHELPDDFDLQSIFTRAHAFSLGRVTGESHEALSAATWQLVGARRFQHLHVWPRDALPAGEHGYEPGFTDHSRAAEAALRTQCQFPLTPSALPTPSSQVVLDVVLVSEHEWFVGHHRTRTGTSRWPGGMRNTPLPADAVSRAWLKMDEALRWSGLPVRRGQTVAEIGCAPGGSCQSLLERGLIVTGIDPAVVDERLLAHPRFTHIRKRGSEVPRRMFAATRWLAADMNVAPEYTLDTVEAIVTHRQVRIRGLLLTLKLPDWSLAAEVPKYLDRIRSWGFAKVRARQLQHNRQEICVAALR
ncbi:MAG TPA: SAM-dependent methyltransferase [Pirellulales bacterium]|jgi:23S rRNA (cytidine2498-2'-O)-methyltransferase|nr:SAM-dependent methyltransferase [Pirellulales bacterium]